MTSVNCKSLVLQNKCNIEIFLSTEGQLSILQEDEMLTEEMFMKQIHKGYHFVLFTIPSNKVCKLIAPDWEKLTETYKNKDRVTVSQVSIV